MVSETRWTKGPWTVAELKGKYYGTDILRPDGERICEIWTHDNGGNTPSQRQIAQWGPFGSDEEREQVLADVICDTHYETERDYTNACLIAAAPAMYEALEAQHQALDILMAMLIEATKDSDKMFMPSKSRIWPMLLQGDSAMKLARGET
jgi:hypothetical protein